MKFDEAESRSSIQQRSRSKALTVTHTTGYPLGGWGLSLVLSVSSYRRRETTRGTAGKVTSATLSISSMYTMALFI